MAFDDCTGSRGFICNARKVQPAAEAGRKAVLLSLMAIGFGGQAVAAAVLAREFRQAGRFLSRTADRPAAAEFSGGEGVLDVAEFTRLAGGS